MKKRIETAQLMYYEGQELNTQQQKPWHDQEQSSCQEIYWQQEYGEVPQLREQA